MTLIHTMGDEGGGCIKLAERVPDSVKATALGILHEAWNGDYYYAEDGRKFGIRPVGGHELKPRWLWWILANTVFNPIREYRVEPVELGLHPISELKETILKWVDSDDDILTQFLDGRQIEYLLDQAKTFDGVVLAARAILGEHEKDAGFKEQLQRLGVPDLEVD